MTRATDLSALTALATASNIGSVDLTPSGGIVAAGYGPWVPNPFHKGVVHIQQDAGTTGATVAIEESNTQSCPVEVGRTDTGSLTGAGTGFLIPDIPPAAFVRIHVVDPGTGGSVTATMTGNGRR